MAEQNQKIVIVVGAGASADFVVSNIVDFGQNHGKVKYEIWDNLDYNTNHIQGKLHYKKDPRKHFLVEKLTGNYAFPSGESLIKLIANQEMILQLLKNLSLDRLLPYLFFISSCSLSTF